MSVLLLIIFLLLTCLYMAWNIGSNDLANAMGTVIGSGALNELQVIILASIFEFVGAVSLGGRVTGTLATGIMPLYKVFLQSDSLLVYGMISSLLSSSLLVTLATFYSLPVSTSHSIVGSILGFGMSCIFRDYLTYEDIYWSNIGNITIGWVLSPIIGAIISYFVFYMIKSIFLRKEEKIYVVEKRFSLLQIITACLISLSHGSNDVSNSIAPLKALILIFAPTTIFYTYTCYELLGFDLSSLLAHHWDLLVLCLGAFGMIIGFWTYGSKVIKTVGGNITKLTPTRGFTAELATAVVVLFHSYSAFPVSTTHVLIGSVIGVGIANGERSINMKILRNILLSWIITVPLSALTTIVTLDLLIYFLNPSAVF